MQKLRANVPPELITALTAAAEQRSISISELVREIIIDWLDCEAPHE